MSNVFPKATTVGIGYRDISCNPYNNIITGRLKIIQQQFNNNTTGVALSASQLAKIRGYYLPVPFTTDSNNSRQNQPGATFTQLFPSKCNYCSNNGDSSTGTCINTSESSLYEQLMNKKGYIFSRRNNSNVQSGPITYIKNGKINTLLQFGGVSGGGLTQNQQLSNMGKGLTPDGKPAKKYGIQRFDGIKLYSNSNIFSDTTPIVNGERPSVFNTNVPFIPIVCESRQFS